MTAPKPRISNDRLAEIIEQRAEDRDVGRCMFVVVSRRTDRNDSVLVEDILLDLRDARARLASLPALVEALTEALAILSVEERRDPFTRETTGPDRVCGITIGPDSDAVLAKARAALALARGVEPKEAP